MDKIYSNSKRNSLIGIVSGDPINFSNTVYVEKRTGIFEPLHIYSPYLSINDQKLICLLDNSCDGGRSQILSRSDEQVSYTVSSGDVSFLLQAIQIHNLNVVTSVEPDTDLKILSRYEPEMRSCLFKDVLSSRIYMGSDEYTNNLLISYILSIIYSQIPVESGMKGVRILHDSTIYDTPKMRWGLNLYEDLIPLEMFMRDERNFIYYHNIDIYKFETSMPNRMRVFTEDFILDMFKQLFVNLQLLQDKYAFNHGNLKKESIYVKNENINIKYSTIRHNSKLTFKIGDFKHASMNIVTNQGIREGNNMINNIRLYNFNKYAHSYFSVLPFKPVIDKSLGETYYIIDDLLDIQLLGKIRHLGIQFYSSFDTVTLILSLLMIPQIYYSVFTNQILKNTIWDVLWHPKEESIIFEKLSKMVESGKSGYTDILDLIKGRWIKCNLTEELVTSLSRIYNK